MLSFYRQDFVFEYPNSKWEIFLQVRERVAMEMPSNHSHYILKLQTAVVQTAQVLVP